MAIFKGTKNEDGRYSMFAYLRRSFYLISPGLFKEYIERYYPDISRIKSFCLLVDFYCSVVFHGVIVPDYFEYAFRERTYYSRRTYITMRDSRRIQHKYNHGSAEVFINKEKFNNTFKDFRTIKNYYFNSNSSIGEFREFVSSCNYKVLAKPLTGHSGYGIHIVDLSTPEKIDDAFMRFNNSQDYFCEELFIQTGVLGEVNSSSVNTLRIYTLYDGKSVNVMYALVRFGGGKSCVDNIHAGGMICEVNVDNGIIVGPGYNLMNQKYLFHPASGHFLLGIQIPLWNRVIEVVKDAALLIPEIGHVAWDIAVSDNSVCIIEANEQGNFDAPQCACQRGAKEVYANFL